MGGVTSNLTIPPSAPYSSCSFRSRNLSYLVAKTLGSDDSDLITDALVGLEIERQLGVVTLNDDLGGLLDGFRAN